MCKNISPHSRAIPNELVSCCYQSIPHFRSNKGTFLVAGDLRKPFATLWFSKILGSTFILPRYCNNCLVFSFSAGRYLLKWFYINCIFLAFCLRVIGLAVDATLDGCGRPNCSLVRWLWFCMAGEGNAKWRRVWLECFISGTLLKIMTFILKWLRSFRQSFMVINNYNLFETGEVRFTLNPRCFNRSWLQ